MRARAAERAGRACRTMRSARPIAVRWRSPVRLARMPRARLLALPCLLLSPSCSPPAAAAAARGDADPARRSRPAPPSTSRASCGPRATSATTRSPPPARSCAPTTPRRKIHELIDKGARRSPTSRRPTYEKDIAPWLGREGRRVGRRRRPRPSPATSCSSRPRTPRRRRRRSTRASRTEKRPVKERSYEGVDYQVDADGVAAGIVGDFFTVGTEPEFKRTVEARGRRLARRRRSATRARSTSSTTTASGSFYVDLKPFIEQALKSDPQARAAARAVPLDLPDRQARAARRRAARRRRPDRVRHGHAAARASARCRRVRPAPRHRRDAADRRAAGRLVGGLRRAERRPGAQEHVHAAWRARSAARRRRSSSSSSTASTSSATSSAGSATSRCSRAARQGRRSRAALVIEATNADNMRSGVRQARRADPEPGRPEGHAR